MIKKCEKHLIVWNWKNITLDDDCDSVTVNGMCERCCRPLLRRNYTLTEVESLMLGIPVRFVP